MISEQNARALEAHSNSGLPFRISLRSVNKGVGPLRWDCHLRFFWQGNWAMPVPLSIR